MKLFFRYMMVLVLVVVICPIIQAEDDVVLTQDLEYINSDLPDVLRDLAEIGGYRLILDRQIQGEVTLTLMRGVTAKEAIATVARGYGYSSRWLNATSLMVGTTAYINGNFAARSTRIHTLKYADPVLVGEKLQTIIPRERIKIDHQKKELTVTADVAEHQNITDLIARMDHSNSSVNLEVRVEELADALWKELQLEMDWGSTELGAAVLNNEQQKLLQGNANQLLLGRSSLTCFNNQEAKILIGDYLPKMSQSDNGANKGASKEIIESGTRLILTPALLNGQQLNLKVNTSVKVNAGQKQNVVRGIHSLIGMNFNQTVLINGALQRYEYLNLKKTVDSNQYPILESMFAKGIVTDQNQTTRIVMLITPRLVNGDEKPVTIDGLELPGIQNDVADPVGSLPSEDLPMKKVEEPVTEVLVPEEEKPVIIFDAVVIPEKQTTNSAKDVVGTSPRRTGFYDIKYIVKPGDTPTAISKKYGTDLAVVLAKNNIDGNDVIKVGTELIVPTPTERIYMVKPKETLWRIAKRYGIAIEVLMDLNGIEDQTKVKEGQALVLPTSNRNVVNPQF